MDATSSSGGDSPAGNEATPTRSHDVPPSRSENVGRIPLRSRLEAPSSSKNKKKVQDADDSDPASTSTEKAPAHKSNQKEREQAPPAARPNVFLPTDPPERKLVLHVVRHLKLRCESENGLDWDFGDGVRFIWLVKKVYSDDPRGYMLFLHLLANENAVRSLASTVEDIKILFRHNTALYIEFDKLLPPSLRMDSKRRAAVEVDVQIQACEAGAAKLRSKSSAVAARNKFKERSAKAERLLAQLQAQAKAQEQALCMTDALSFVMRPEIHREMLDTMDNIKDGRITLVEGVRRLTPVMKMYPNLVNVMTFMYQKVVAPHLASLGRRQ